MKLERYLNEYGYVSQGTSHDFGEQQRLWREYVLPTIKEDCSDFIKESNRLLYRGVNKDIDVMKKFKPRKNRRPTDTPSGIQKGFDDSALKMFRWKPRSEGVFVTPLKSQAGGYGKIYIFFPINGYKYIWSPDIKDFYGKWNKDIKDELHFGSGDPDWWKDFMLKYYQNYGMKDNTTSEMMFHCPKGYYMVDGDYLEAFKQEFKFVR